MYRSHMPAKYFEQLKYLQISMVIGKYLIGTKTYGSAYKSYTNRSAAAGWALFETNARSHKYAMLYKWCPSNETIKICALLIYCIIANRRPWHYEMDYRSVKQSTLRLSTSWGARLKRKTTGSKPEGAPSDIFRKPALPRPDTLDSFETTKKLLYCGPDHVTEPLLCLMFFLRRIIDR